MTQGQHSISPTGRLVYHGEVKGRMSVPFPLTAKQREVLSRLVDDQVQVGSRTFSRSELFSVFKGENLPRDTEVCKLLDVDYSPLEQRIVAALGHLSPDNPYGFKLMQFNSDD